jgi:lysophospholipase L1-like esterase
MVFHYDKRQAGRRLVRGAIAGTSVGVLAGILLFQCSDRISPVRKPLVISAVADSTVLVNDTLKIRVSAQGATAGPVSYVWFTDNPAAPDTSSDSLLAKVFTVADTGRRCVVVKAIDRGGVVSAPDSLHICVRWLRPGLTLRVVSPIAVADTELAIAVPVDSCGTIQMVRWMIDSFSFMTKSDSIRWLFNDKVNTLHTIRLSVVDNNGFVSDTDSVKVLVLLQRPQVVLTPHDTAVYSFTNLKFMASGSDSGGTVARYAWMLDGRPVVNMYDSLTESWGAASAGAHFLTVTAINADSLASQPDSAIITVMPGGPTLTPLHDTTLSNLDTMNIVCRAGDPNGTIVKYLWNLSGSAGWSDSTVAATHTMSYSGSALVSAVVAARDNHGLVGADTFTVNFNVGPESLAVATPKLFDTILVSQNSPVCSLSFSYGAVGTGLGGITYTVLWGASGDSLTATYQGQNQSTQIGGICPGGYTWKIIARDTFGHSVSKGGTVTVLRQYLVAFVGHSIVAGYQGNNISGGFREGVLDSIRAHLGPYERAKAVGPVTPPYMAPTNIDDSCLALSAATGFEVWQSLSAISTQLTADVWVLMTGVNDNYAPVGLTYAVMMMDIMHSRNPNSRIYVLNGVVRPNADYNQSFVDGDYWLPSFNQGLADSIQAQNAAGTAIFQVNADSALCPGDTFSPTYMPADSLHPDQPGYDTLAKCIYSVMRSSVPPAIP